MEHYVSIAICRNTWKNNNNSMAYHLFEDFDKTSVLIGDGTGHGQVGSKYLFQKHVDSRSFLTLSSDYAIINNIELDHVGGVGILKDIFNLLNNLLNKLRKQLLFGE